MKIRFLLGLFILAVVPAAPVLAAAAIEGRVRLPAVSVTTVINRRYEVVTKGGALSTNPPLAIVYLEGDFPRPAITAVVQMIQKDLMFTPALLPVQTGTRVEFPNQDDTYHNIFSYSAPKRFDLGRYRGDERPIPSQVFDRPGLVTVRCDIHDHMRALILVVDTPHFVVTDEEGRYRFPAVPPGRYVLKAWLDSRTVRSQPVEVTADAVLRIDFP
jgi:plastocyanin